jgi:hydroxyacylglutathione hydrolase
VKQLYPDLWQSRAARPFGPGMSTHAYLLTRSTGNILFYNPSSSDDYDHIRRLGSIARQYLSHRDEAGAGLTQIKQLFGAQLCCHRLEEAAVGVWLRVDIVSDQRETHLGVIEVIPTPGHTAGSSCFLVRSSCGKSYLFTGGTILPEGDSWDTYFSPAQTLTLVESLTVLSELAPDVALSRALTGPFSFRELSPDQWPAIVNSVIHRLSTLGASCRESSSPGKLREPLS